MSFWTMERYSCALTLVLGRGTPYSLAESITMLRSLSCMEDLKPGMRLPSKILGGFTSSVQHWAAPPLMAFTTLLGSTPHFSEKTSSSPIATICAATIIWLADLH